MGNNNIYNKWKEYRKKVHISEDFSYRVMDRIYGYENTREIKATGIQIPDSHAILNWLLRFALALGLLAINYQWAYGRLM